MSSKAFVSAAVLVFLIVAAAGLCLTGARAEQPAFIWQEGRHFDGRSQHVVLPHDPKWGLAGGTLVLDFTADRLKGAQGLLSKDAKGFGDGGHLVIWLDDDEVVVRVQDKKRGHIVRSPAKAVREGVPIRLALAFGAGGMKLFLDGKEVGTNAYAGGLKGNQEPVVIGARDWASSPRAANNLDAFFAGTISGFALYGQTLDAPAIAALGPAGTALAQASGPAKGNAGQQQPATAGVAVTTPLAPKVAVAPPQQTVPVQIEVGPTITIKPNSTSDIGSLQRQQQQSPIELRSGQSFALQPSRDEAAAVAMFWERAKKAAASQDLDEQRAALFVELVKAAFKTQKSNEELRGLEWWARVMKVKRIQAAEGAQQAFNEWQSGKTAPRTSGIAVLLGDDKVNTPSYEVLLASGFERVSGPGTAAANQSWPKVLKRLEAAKIELQTTAGGDVDVQAILDGVVMTLSYLKDGFTGWTTVAGTAYSIASTRWKQVQQAQELPGKLQGFVSFAKATTPSLTESLYTEEGAKQAYVALVETTL